VSWSEPVPTYPTNNRKGDPHLRSGREVQKYTVHASDGDLGHVEDFLFDDENWDIRYMVVALRNWFPGRKVLISPAWFVGRISWTEHRVNVIMTQEDIRNSPEYDPAMPVLH